MPHIDYLFVFSIAKMTSCALNGRILPPPEYPTRYIAHALHARCESVTSTSVGTDACGLPTVYLRALATRTHRSDCAIYGRS